MKGSGRAKVEKCFEYTLFKNKVEKEIFFRDSFKLSLKERQAKEREWFFGRQWSKNK